jgi:hypothetical protein
MTTSLISGFPSRDTCVQRQPLPPTKFARRSAEVQTPTTWLFVSSCAMGTCRPIVCTA